MDSDEQRAGCRPLRDEPPTTTSPRVWRTACELTALTGGLCAVAEWGWQTPVLCGLALAMLGVAFGSVAWWGTHPVDAVWPVVLRALLAGMLTVAAVGLVTVLGVLGTLAVLALVVTNPLLRTWVGRVVPYREAAMWRGDLARVSDEALWQAWRRSDTMLGVARSAAVRVGLVRQREEYLDELIRRHPHVTAGWFTPRSGG